MISNDPDLHAWLAPPHRLSRSWNAPIPGCSPSMSLSRWSKRRRSRMREDAGMRALVARAGLDDTGPFFRPHRHLRPAAAGQAPGGREQPQHPGPSRSDWPLPCPATSKRQRPSSRAASSNTRRAGLGLPPCRRDPASLPSSSQPHHRRHRDPQVSCHLGVERARLRVRQHDPAPQRVRLRRRRRARPAQQLSPLGIANRQRRFRPACPRHPLSIEL
jgi:hypothetical protein